MRRRWMLGVACGLGLVWWLSGGEPAESKLDGVATPTRNADALRNAMVGIKRDGTIRLADIRMELRDSGLIQITGNVIDRLSHDHVGEVEVVFRGRDGEQSTIAGADGSYRIEVSPGAYRAFIRDDSVLSVGFPVEERLPGFPDLDAIGTPDDSSLPLVIAQADLEDVDLFVLRGGTITGSVLDGAGNPVPHAIVRVIQSEKRMRPVLGSDVVESDAKGGYELKVPAGNYYFEVSHPRFAGLGIDALGEPLHLAAGGRESRDLRLVAGCVITGKVIGANGQPAGDGALELGYDGGFSPAGKILADGTFRFSTPADYDLRLRAWPWKSPPSPEQTFPCREGARFNVTFMIPSRGPDISGVLVDAAGQPVPLAFYDLSPLDEGGISQQERSGVDGTWGVFAMPAGRYQLTAYAPGRGVVSTIVTSPSANVRLQLGGTGSIDGSSTEIKNGSFEVTFTSCSLDGSMIKITEDARLISVRDGKFTIDNLPACELTATFKHRDTTTNILVSIKPNTKTPLVFEEADSFIDAHGTSDDSPDEEPEIEMPADDDGPVIPENADSIY